MSSHTEIKKDDNVILSKNGYEELMRAGIFLDSLEAHGVDNWVGYGDAYNEYEEWLEDDHED